MTILETLHSLPPLNLWSLSFLFLLLPASLVVFYLLPQRFRPALLLLVSLGFYALSQPEKFPLFAGLLAVDCALLWTLYRAPANKKIVLFRVVAAKSAVQAGGFLVMAQIRQEAVPLGIFVASVSAVWCALAVRRGEAPAENGLRDYPLYAAFFPRLLAGPLLPFDDFAAQSPRITFSPDGLLNGLNKLLLGAFKLLVFGAGLNRLYSAIGAIPADQNSVLAGWCRMLTLALALYYSLSGVTDMAAGTAELFGIKLPQNFYYPYQSRSVQDFLERFNSTWSLFLKTAVYEPFAADGGRAAKALGLVAAGALWGLWFGLRPGYLLWGVCFALAVLLEHTLLKRFVRNAPILFCRVYTAFFVLLSFPVFDCGSLAQIAETYASLFGLDPTLPTMNDRIRYLLSSNWLLLVLCAFFATNVFDLLARQLRRQVPRIGRLAVIILDAGVLLVFLAFSIQTSAAVGDIVSLAARLESAVLRQIPERQRLRELSFEMMLLTGQREYRPGNAGNGNSIFISERGLMENIAPPDSALVSRNTSAILEFSRQAAELQATTAVMLLPTAGAILQDDLPPYAQSVMTNQFQVIEEVYSRLTAPIVTANAYSALINRRSQYIYYRTEDNLTALGGFYVGQMLAAKLGFDTPRLSQYEIDYSDNAYYGGLYSQSPYVNVAADTISQFRLSAVAGRGRQYLVTRSGESGTAVYHTMYPGYAAELGEPMDIYFGGPAWVTDVRTSLLGAPRALVFGDFTAAAWLPFLCDVCEQVTLVDLEAPPDKLAGIDPGDYDIVLFGFGIESFIHTDIPSRALSLLEERP